ncbi:hypothetical protein H4R21_006190 [Coemansia helicoidea]|uniref:Uncharacterized protein n=1 Tax=Coemansia helicoidea TaxID=1286919 RepID=A0ACC1KN69_9FUNG|nr:hypothetical protein H4R21_006190 [Coemansia helicoidea]
MDSEAGTVIKDTHGITLTVKGDRFVKSGRRARLQETYNLEYVQGKVACPKLYGYHQEGDVVSIEMEYVKGKTLSEIWQTIDDKQRQRVVDNIIREIHKLHEFSNGDSRTRGINDTTIHDLLLGEMRFDDEAALNNHLVGRAKNSVKMAYLVRNMLPTSSRFCLSHGFLFSCHIIVKEDMDVVFVSWGHLGFLPEYWDAVKLFTLSSVRDELTYDIATRLNTSDSTIAAFKSIYSTMF